MKKTLFIRLPWWRTHRFLPDEWERVHTNTDIGALIVEHGVGVTVYAPGRWRSYRVREAT